MNEQLQKILPVTILVTTYNRKSLLEKCIKLINRNTFYQFRIIVIDNASTDGTQGLLKEMKVQGKIFDAIFMEENVGQCRALSVGFDAVEQWENNKERMHRPSNDFIVSTQDDLYPPMLGQDNCWLKQMIEILERNEPEYGGLCMRIQRMPRTDIDESKEIIPGYKNFPSVYRLMRRSDIRKIDKKNKFGELKKWESNIAGENYKNIIRKKFGFTTHIYCDHAGFMLEKKGFPEDVETFTVAENKLNERNEKPYPDIDSLTNEPIKINHNSDLAEQKLRDNYKKQIEGKNIGAEITLIVLTCNRLEGLKKIINSIKEKTVDIPYNLLVVADNDDTIAYNYCLENGIECILSNYKRDFVAQANLGAYICNTPYFVILSDDSEIIQNDWLSRGMKIYKEKFLDNFGILLFNDCIQHDRVFIFGLVSKKMLEELGGDLFYRGYIHFKGDRELAQIAKGLGKIHYEESIKIAHHHWQSDLTIKKDETYSISNGFFSRDQDIRHYRQNKLDLLKERNKYNYFK